MPIKFNCHKCGANLRVPEKHIGKKARCPKCDEKCLVPETSQRADSGSSFGLDPSSGMLGPPAAAPVGLPSSMPATPLNSPAPPAMAMPVSPAALPSSLPSVTTTSPYAAPMAGKKRRTGGASPAVAKPLYDVRFFIKLFGWVMFVAGILYLMAAVFQTLMGLIGAATLMGSQRSSGVGVGYGIGVMIGTVVSFALGAVIVWLGWQVKGAGEAITVAFETGDSNQARLAHERIAKYFRVMGIFTIVWLVMMALAIGFVMLLMMIGFAASR